MKCLGLDIGHGDTKAFDGVRIISFPTAVSMAVDDGGFERQDLCHVLITRSSMPATM